MKLKFLLLAGLIFASSSYAANTTPKMDIQQPVVYSYWAGWANADIPNFNFNGLFLAFAFMKSNFPGSYYTDYSASGNFQKPASTGPYVTWNNWEHTFYNSGARSYVSYGGGTNDEFRGLVINANDSQLSSMAGEIKANIKKYYFDGVDLDIENWWNFDNNANQKFAKNLATLVKQLRVSLDSDPATNGKAIMIAVGWNAAGHVDGMSDSSSYTGSMQPFFSDNAALDAISAVNIMSYNTCITNFYSRQDLVGNILAAFANAGVPKQKIIFGVQPYECSGHAPATPLNMVVALGQFIKSSNYGGLFLWGMGTQGLGSLSSWDYINAMKSGLSLK